MKARPRNLLVGFGHKARHGKDWVCQRIHEAIPEATKVYSLALPMYYMADSLFGMHEKDGKLLQALGTDVGRRAKDAYWIDLLHRHILRDDPPIALIADLRFLNEAAWIKSNNGICIKVERLNPDGTVYADPDRPANHQSETELMDFSWNQKIIAESGDLTALGYGAAAVAEHLLRWLGGEPTTISEGWASRPPEHKNFPRAYVPRQDRMR